MTIESLLLAFGFGNLAMLGWLAAAAAPLLIHLWSRRRYRQVPWAAVQFLLAAMKKNARRMQLQQWLLLAIRTLIILLVVLAVAEPYGEGLLAGSGTTPTHKVLVIDSSFSMAYREADESLFARAQRLAAELVRKSGSGDEFTLVQMAQLPKTVLGRETIDRAMIIDAIESFPQTQAGANLSATYSLITEALASGKAGDRPLERQEVIFFTDLQRATWGHENVALVPELAAASLVDQPPKSADRVADLASHAKLLVVDVAPNQRSNLAVTQFSVAEPFVTLGADIDFELALHEFGNQPRRQCAVELLVDEEPVGEQVIDVPAGGDASVRFTHRFRSAGAHTVALRAAADPLPIDNTRWLASDVAEEIRVLCVAGKPDAARYVADALDPDVTDGSPIRPVVVSEGDLAEVEFSDFVCIFLCNVAQLAPNEANRLARFVEQGGGLVFFVGDQVLAARYNALANGERALLPARLGELIAEPQFRLDPLAYRHPIVAPFRGRERAGLLTTPVSRHFRLELPEQADDREVALALASGDPLIVTRQLGRGRSILVATDGSLSSADPTSGEPWTAWPTWPSFLPIVRELLNYAVGGQVAEHAQLVGTRLEGFLHHGSAQSVVHVTRPDKRTDSVSPTSSPAGWEWSYDRTELGGIYRANADSNVAASQLFAVNVDTRESDLSKVAAGDLPPQFVVRQDWQADRESLKDSLVSHAGWHAALLAWAFGLMLFESLLAWFFGRGTA